MQTLDAFPKRGTTLGVEALEDRLAPATLTVLNNNPWGVGSLQQAVLNSGSGDTISFAPSLAHSLAHSFTTRLPMFSPRNKPMSARGIFSNPSTTSS